MLWACRGAESDARTCHASLPTTLPAGNSVKAETRSGVMPHVDARRRQPERWKPTTSMTPYSDGQAKTNPIREEGSVRRFPPTIVDPITAKESAIYKKKILKHIFVFAGYHYLQVQGGADGDILCPIVRQPVPRDVGESLWRAKPFLYMCHVITWHRYMDDILLVWGGPMTVTVFPIRT